MEIHFHSFYFIQYIIETTHFFQKKEGVERRGGENENEKKKTST